jgi:hypothetical protein
MGCDRDKRESHGGQGEEIRERTRERESKRKGKRKGDSRRKKARYNRVGKPPRKKTRATKLIYQAVLHDDDVNTIADAMTPITLLQPITTFTTVQDAMKKAIEA